MITKKNFFFKLLVRPILFQAQCVLSFFFNPSTSMLPFIWATKINWHATPAFMQIIS